MKGDFSRLTFDPSKAYTGVLMQQGRVQLDSDWNEQVLIAEHLERRRFEDLAGPFAAPGGDGFQVHAAEDGAPALGPGRIYAGGLICALDAETPVSHVARRPLRPRAGKTDLVYLDVWERLVTALDNPNLRDVALGGPDTATRLETAWAIDFVEDVTSPESAAAALPKPASGWMSAAASDGYLGMENQLYRVEIHSAGGLGTATFKWSRHNGAVVFPIEQFVRRDSALLGPGFLDSWTISVGDWAEIGGDEQEQLGLPGTLARFKKWTPETREAVFDRDIWEHAKEKRPRARRWDQSAAPTMPVNRNWVDLEAGIRVRFGGSDFRTGDYWTIPARVASTTVEWPGEAPPQGVEHHFYPLALATWEGAGADFSATYRDCRQTFVSLTEMYAELCHLREQVLALARSTEAG